MVAKKFIKFILFSGLTVLLAILIAQFGPTPQQASANTANVTGWMWSDNIGWVSLSCDNTSSCGSSAYGTTQETDGSWTGYGWSDTIGWIKFDAGCPPGAEGECDTKMIGTNLKGWARFCAGSDNNACGATPRTDGWDGWVSLSSTNDQDFSLAGIQTSPFTYGSTQSGANVTGYAWGSTVVGWLQVMAELPPPEGALAIGISVAKPTSYGEASNFPGTLNTNNQTGSVVLTWYKYQNTIAYTSCAASSTAPGSNNWNGLALPAPADMPDFQYQQNVTYDFGATASPITYTIDCIRSTGEHDLVQAELKKINNNSLALKISLVKPANHGQAVILSTLLTTSNQTGNVVLTWYKANNATSYTTCNASSTAPGSNNWNGFTMLAPGNTPDFKYQENVSYNFATATSPITYTVTCTRSTGGTDSATAQLQKTGGNTCTVNLSGGGGFCASGPNARTPQMAWNSTNAADCYETSGSWFTGSNASNHPTSGTQNVGAGTYQVSCHVSGNPSNTCTSGIETVTQLATNNPICLRVTHECSDSLDNDADGKTDYPADSGCTSSTDNSEKNSGPTVIEH